MAPDGPVPSPNDYPPPLDLTNGVPSNPFLVKAGPGFEWHDGKLVVMFATPGGPVLWKTLEPDESRRLLEWMLRSVEVAGG